MDSDDENRDYDGSTDLGNIFFQESKVASQSQFFQQSQRSKTAASQIFSQLNFGSQESLFSRNEAQSQFNFENPRKLARLSNVNEENDFHEIIREESDEFEEGGYGSNFIEEKQEILSNANMMSQFRFLSQDDFQRHSIYAIQRRNATAAIPTHDQNVSGRLVYQNSYTEDSQFDFDGPKNAIYSKNAYLSGRQAEVSSIQSIRSKQNDRMISQSSQRNSISSRTSSHQIELINLRSRESQNFMNSQSDKSNEVSRSRQDSQKNTDVESQSIFSTPRDPEHRETVKQKTPKRSKYAEFREETDEIRFFDNQEIQNDRNSQALQFLRNNEEEKTNFDANNDYEISSYASSIVNFNLYDKFYKSTETENSNAENFSSQNLIVPSIYSTQSVEFVAEISPIPESITQLYKFVKNNYSDWAFIYALAAQICSEKFPMSSYVNLKISLLLSVVSTGDSKESPIPIVAFGQNVGDANTIMQKVGRFGER